MVTGSTAAADRDHDRVELTAGLFQQLQAERSLAGADLGLVVRMAEQRADLGGMLDGRLVALGVTTA